MGARIAERSKRAIVERVDMARIVGETVRLKRRGNRLLGLCPFHEEKTPSFNVNLSEKVFFCHGCGAGGDIIKFVRELHGFSFAESLEYLADRCGVAVEYEQADPRKMAQEKKRRSQRRRLLDLNNAAQQFYVGQLHGKAGANARAYLEKRGLSRETAERFGVGCAPDSWDSLSNHLLGRGFEAEELALVGLGMPRRNGSGLIDRFRDRLMYPVRSTTGDLIAFGGRALGNDPRAGKYMNSPESELATVETEFNTGLSRFFKKGRCVFGLYEARQGIRQRKQALIVEGNLDVMMLHQVGYTNAVCAMGTALTIEQLKEVQRFTEEVALVFDGDKAGRAAARKSVPLCIETGLGGVFVSLPEGDDPDSFVRDRGVDAFGQLLGDAQPMVMGYVDALIAENGATIHGKRKTIEAVQPVLVRVSDPIVREMARTYMARRLELDVADLQRFLRQVKPQPGMRPASRTSAPRRIDEPQLERVELDLVRVLCRRPSRITYVVEEGCLRDVRHENLRKFLEMFGGRAATLTDAQRSLDGTELKAWVQELPDGRVRRAFLEGLVRADLIAASTADIELLSVLDRLEKWKLEGDRDALKTKLKSAPKSGVPMSEIARMYERQQRIVARIAELRESMAKASRSVAAGRLLEE